MRHETSADWPFYREDPDKVVLEPRPGAVPSTKPPVRIFLGTEEAQYRAERIFFYSIEQVRDPSRTYEIHLMKNVLGFNRRHWRTGFTNYRYAIPDFAGRKGKAIYNDVDQIYLADPAHLFDLDMDGHGYLAISASDTSVMLIDCERMWPMWNRAAASNGNKYSLLAKPKKTPGLWGVLDPHWNARDQEYVEGRTGCLHYTTLHQQPWEPFPEHYSYHPNPLGYVWHDLERQADATGYQPFSRAAPSPGFARCRGSNTPRPPGRAADLPSPEAVALFRGLGVRSAIALTAAGTERRLEVGRLAEEPIEHLTLRGSSDPWPASDADAVILHDLLEHVPPADLGWLLDEAFKRAGRAVYVAVDATAARGLGSAEWWERRVALTAASRLGVSWHVDAVLPEGGVRARAVRLGEAPAHPRAWALLTGVPAEDASIERLAAALDMPVERKRLASRPRGWFGSRSRATSPSGPEQALSNPLGGHWPDLLISADPAAVAAAQSIKAKSGGAARLVHLGPPRAPLSGFDLVVARPQDRLPIRDNVLHTAAPLAVAPEEVGPDARSWLDRLAPLQRPLTVVVVTGGVRPWVMPAEQAAELGRRAAVDVAGGEGTLLVLPARAEAVGAAEAVARAAGRAGRKVELWPEIAEAGPAVLPAVLAEADRVVLTNDDQDNLVRASLAGRAAWLYELPLWHDRVRALRPLVKLLALLTGGGTTYRGTPHQQHAPGRLIDALAARGIAVLGPDHQALERALVARGLVARLGEAGVTTRPRPLDDLERIVERVRALLRTSSEQPRASR